MRNDSASAPDNDPAVPAEGVEPVWIPLNHLFPVIKNSFAELQRCIAEALRRHPPDMSAQLYSPPTYSIVPALQAELPVYDPEIHGRPGMPTAGQRSRHLLGFISEKMLGYLLQEGLVELQDAPIKIQSQAQAQRTGGIAYNHLPAHNDNGEWVRMLERARLVERFPRGRRNERPVLIAEPPTVPLEEHLDMVDQVVGDVDNTTAQASVIIPINLVPVGFYVNVRPLNDLVACHSRPLLRQMVRGLAQAQRESPDRPKLLRLIHDDSGNLQLQMEAAVVKYLMNDRKLELVTGMSQGDEWEKKMLAAGLARLVSDKRSQER